MIMCNLYSIPILYGRTKPGGGNVLESVSKIETRAMHFVALKEVSTYHLDSLFSGMICNSQIYMYRALIVHVLPPVD